MKNFGAATFRFLTASAVSLVVVSAVLMTDATLEYGEEGFLDTLVGIAAASVPIAVTAASFITFFLLNRLFSSRIAGYLVITPLAILAIAGPAAIIRFTGLPFGDGIASLPAGYRATGEWMLNVARASWLETGVGIASFAAFAASFWGCTRLSRNRPLLGAFIAPSGVIAALYLFSVFLSGPADALFALIGLQVSSLLSAAILTAAGALALMLFDALFARKPTGGHKDA